MIFAFLSSFHLHLPVPYAYRRAGGAFLPSLLFPSYLLSSFVIPPRLGLAAVAPRQRDTLLGSDRPLDVLTSLTAGTCSVSRTRNEPHTIAFSAALEQPFLRPLHLANSTPRTNDSFATTSCDCSRDSDCESPHRRNCRARFSARGGNSGLGWTWRSCDRLRPGGGRGSIGCQNPKTREAINLFPDPAVLILYSTWPNTARG